MRHIARTILKIFVQLLYNVDKGLSHIEKILNELHQNAGRNCKKKKKEVQ